MTKKYTREDRYKAAALFIGTGNSMAVSRETDIPASTVRHWLHYDEDFQLMCEEIRVEFDDKIKYKYVQIIDEAADQVMDRSENGDFVRDNRTGELVRVPVKGKDATVIGAIHFDKLRLAENQPTKIVQHESSEARLQQLANLFASISLASQRDDKGEYERLTEPFGDTALPMPEKGEDE
jgi:hypothetical protein